MNVIIGVNQGSYTVNANTRQITLSNLYFTPTIESLYVVLNITQDKMYYAAAQSYTKPVTITADGSNWILEYSTIFPILAAGDKLHIQFECCQGNHICEENTTSTPLGAGATFTGGWQDCINYQEVNISVATDQNSATNGFVIEWSADGTTVGDDDKFSVYANLGTNYTPNPSFRYVRVKYTNGATPQTVFSLMTILRTTITGGSFHRIDSTLKDDSDARLSITIPKLKTAANTYVSQTATTSGNAKMSLEELESDVSVNDNTQLRVTPFSSDGNEGIQLQDESGTAYGVKHVQNKPRVSAMPYLYDIAEGNVTGHMPFQRFGFNDTLSTSEETIWSHSSQYVWPTAGSQIRVVSSDAQDTTDTGTGAWTVSIEYLKSDFTSGSVTLNMNGVNNVDSGVGHADVFRVNSFRIATAGTSNTAIGNITLTQVTGGKVVGYIKAGKTRDRSTIMTVPLGKTLYITSFSASAVGTKYVLVTLHVGCVVSTGALIQRGMFYPTSEVLLLNNAYTKELTMPLKIPATCDLKASVTAEAAGSLVSCAIRGWIE
jgi:hypothetical protein